MNIFSIIWENLRVILLVTRSRYKVNISSMDLICTKWKKYNNLYYFHKVKNNREIMKNVLLSTKWSNIKWLSLFLYIQRYFISTKWKRIYEVIISTKSKLIQKETGDCRKRFSIKVEIIVIFLFSMFISIFLRSYFLCGFTYLISTKWKKWN